MKSIRELIDWLPREHRANIIGGMVYFLLLLLGVAMTYPEWFQ